MRFHKVIVAEKPGVARAFAVYLAESRPSITEISGARVYTFRRDDRIWASIGIRGHLMDFDFPPEYNKWHSVDPLVLFKLKPAMTLREGMLKYVKALQQLAKQTTTVVLALDADTEGEAIAFEVMEVMRRANPSLRFERAWFAAVTREDLLNAIVQPRQPNPRWANKVFARMVLDLTIGAAFTRLLTLTVEKRNGGLPRGRFISYGPCQTPVLYLVVKRAIEREQFKKKKYYQIVAAVKISEHKLRVKSERKFDSREEAQAAASQLLKNPIGVVVEAAYKERVIEPPEPLATVEMERRASRFLNIRPKRAMDIAEDLYQEGLISYPRTDTTIYPPTLNLRAIASMFTAHEDLGPFVRSVILSKPTLRVRQGKEDDGAHPPIYPLRYVKREEVVKRFGEEGFKLYDLVVRHFLATLSPPMRIEEQFIAVEVGGLKLTAEGLRILDPGYTIVYPFERPHETVLPHLERGVRVDLIEAKIAELETKPPPYLSEAELLRLMKRYGIGTDATMQEHIHTNIERKYFEVVRKQCIPTPLGKALILALSEVAPETVLPEVRGRMEAELSRIAEGAADPDQVIESVKAEFMKHFIKLREAEHKITPILMQGVTAVYGSRSKSKGS
ncbi:MAG: type IA DNA topoisomerase [Thermofilaceae archaeon]